MRMILTLIEGTPMKLGSGSEKAPKCLGKRDVESPLPGSERENDDQKLFPSPPHEVETPIARTLNPGSSSPEGYGFHFAGFRMAGRLRK
ncbi:hypothetical protein STEG23_030101 [Scotinomys teguina]